jgi:hypothetical protein
MSLAYGIIVGTCTVLQLVVVASGGDTKHDPDRKRYTCC